MTIKLHLVMLDTERHLAFYSNRHGISLTIPAAEHVKQIIFIHIMEDGK